ncbi:MAG: hypothetical protein WCQ60_02035 [bacterium]
MASPRGYYFRELLHERKIVMKQVPEDKQTVNTEQQLNTLREKLMGNQAFAACRGKLGPRMTDFVTQFITEAESPTGFCNRWDDFFGKARVMGNLLAQFKRDGLTTAYDELFGALHSESHLFPGEVIPIEETTPVTLVMLDPKRTFLMLKWLLEEHWDSLNAYLEWKEGRLDREPSDLVKQLFEAFPTLEKHTTERRRRGDYEGDDLIAAYTDTVFSKFPMVTTSIKLFDDRCLLEHDQWNDHVEIGQHPFCLLLRMEQSEVLKMFSRKEQKLVATWQFNAPKMLKNYGVGLHPESFHAGFSKSHPALVSLGLSQGFGAVILTKNPMDRQWEGKHFFPTSWHSHAKSGTYGIAFYTNWPTEK